MKTIITACFSAIVIAGIAGLQKQEECIPGSEIALANVVALCDDEWEIDIDYDKACLDERGDGCALSSTDWRPRNKPYNE